MSRKPQSKPKVSAFAHVLQQMLDETGFYTRAEWSQFLGISEPALSQWANDRTIPRADLLRMIINLLKTRGGAAAKEALTTLEALMDEPAEKISPIGARFTPNLRAYLSVRSLGELGRSLRSLPVAEQIAVLRDGSLGAPAIDVSVEAQPVETVSTKPLSHGLGPAWRMPRLVRACGPHARERQVSVEEFATGPRTVLVGPPGSGKTSFLSYLRTQHPRWQQSEGISLRNYSADEFGEWLAVRGSREPSKPLIVDGLDEMPMGHRKQVVTLIDRFSEQVHETRMLIASRPLSELDRLSVFDSFSIAPLSDVDLVAEVTRSSLASKSPVEVDRFLCHLTERESLRTALRNPLFLKIAWSLFEHSAVTPFAEGVIVREYTRVLFGRDHSKGFSRVREPWATSHSLLALLGEVSLHLLHHEKDTFDERILTEWIDQSSRKVPIGKLLDLLLGLGLLTENDQQYCFSHRILRDYFAARSVMESVESAVDYFRSASKRASLNGALRIASSLARDATPLLETIMSSEKSHSINFTLLAQMLAQPIIARPKVLNDSCRALVSWLSDQTSDWKIVDDDHASSDTSAKWLVCAHVGGTKGVNAIAGTLRAIHQARSGPAYEPLKAHLSEAQSPFLPIFSEAMDVEGRLKVNFETHVPRGAARVAVENLQLA